jgi:hypothetical protein
MVQPSCGVSFCLGVLLLALAAPAGAAPERAGFTGDLTIGFALTTRTTGSACFGSSGPCPDDGETTHVEPGLAPVGVSLGGYLTPRIALLGRLAGTSYFRGNNQYLHTFAGPVVEVWPHDRLFLAGGIGFGSRGPNPLFGASSVHPDSGLALDVRAGVAVLNGVKHALTVSLEVIPALVDEFEDLHIGGALLVGWKWY